jgi:drug/metabolite transporter (DMT)-like permease
MSIIERPSRLLAIGEGLLIVLILGSTLVLVKMVLGSMGPLTIVGLRYSLAFLVLLPFMIRREVQMRFSSPLWIRLSLIGISFYVIGNGALFWGLKYIPATTGSLLLSLVPLLVLLAGIPWLKEVPKRLQIVGVFVGLAGSGLFFSPGPKAGEPLGIGIVAVGLLGIASFSLLGRGLARDRLVGTLPLTAIPLAIGAVILLPMAFSIEGLPGSSTKAWGMVLLLAVINTACVYMLYNHALKVLPAFELSVIVNLTPLVTAFWAWLLLEERLSIIQIMGIVAVIGGVALVQWKKQRGSVSPPIVKCP